MRNVPHTLHITCLNTYFPTGSIASGDYRTFQWWRLAVELQHLTVFFLSFLIAVGPQLPLSVACCHVSPAMVHTHFGNIGPGKLPVLRHFWLQTTDSDGLAVLLPCSNQSPARFLLRQRQTLSLLLSSVLLFSFFFSLIVTTSAFLLLWAKCPHDLDYGSSL